MGRFERRRPGGIGRRAGGALVAAALLALAAPGHAGLPPDACVAGSPCDDGDFCTQGDRCQGGVCVGAAAFLVRERARLGNGARLAADLTVNASGGHLALGRRVETTGAVTIVGDQVRLGVGAHVHDVVYNVLNAGARRATIAGAEITPLETPVYDTPCPLAPVPCGAGDVEVPADGVLDLLAPQAYGRLVVRDGGSLTLMPGTFVFCAVEIGRNATVAVLGDSESLLHVAGRLLVGRNSRLGPAAGSPMPQIAVEGTQVKVGRGSRLEAMLVAPEARLRVGSGGVVSGRACARAVLTGRGATLTCDAACGDRLVTPGEGCDDGNLDDGDGCSAACLLECGGSVCAPGEFCINDQCLAIAP